MTDDDDKMMTWWYQFGVWVGTGGVQGRFCVEKRANGASARRLAAAQLSRWWAGDDDGAVDDGGNGDDVLKDSVKSNDEGKPSLH